MRFEALRTKQTCCCCKQMRCVVRPKEMRSSLSARPKRTLSKVPVEQKAIPGLFQMEPFPKQLHGVFQKTRDGHRDACNFVLEPVRSLREVLLVFIGDQLPAKG